MKRAAIILLAMVLVQAADSLGWTGQKKATDVPASPHHSDRDCSQCHEDGREKEGAASLRYQGRYQELCRCHTSSPDDYNHPIELTPPEEGKDFLEQRAYVQDGLITCNACHDMKVLRAPLPGGAAAPPSPGVVKTESCFACHDRESTESFSPHAEAGDGGDNCNACHSRRPHEKTDGFGDVDFLEDMDELCLRCHRVKPNHPSGANHLRKPSGKGLDRISRLAERFRLPVVLNRSGKVTCTTCHNPHAPGMIPDSRPGARGAGSLARQRVPNAICMECHQV